MSAMCPGCIVDSTASQRRQTMKGITSPDVLIVGGLGSNAYCNNNNSTDDSTTTTPLLCPSCIQATLQSVRERHQLAKETWYESRTKCSQYFLQQQQQRNDQRSAEPCTESSIRLYEQRYQQLRKEFEALQNDCTTATMETCAMNVRMMERQEYIQSSSVMTTTTTNGPNPLAASQQRRQILSQLQQSLCGNNICSNNNNNPTSSNNNGNETSEDVDPVATETMTSNCLRPEHITGGGGGGGALIQSIEMAQMTVRTIRFHWSLQAFAMFRLQIDHDDLYNDATKQEEEVTTGRDEIATGTTNHNETSTNGHGRNRRRQRRNLNGTNNVVVVSGIGTICGLPLPHAGMELYGVLPGEELQSALRLVAQLTQLISRCFHIALPHPIVILPPKQQLSSSISSSSVQSPNGPILHNRQQHSRTSTMKSCDDGDIANLAYSRSNLSVDHTNESLSSSTFVNPITLSLTSLSSLLTGGGIGMVESRPPQQQQQSSGSSSPTQRNKQQVLLLSMDPKQVEERIRHATSAIVAEDHSRTTFYTLSTIRTTTSTNRVATNGDSTSDETTTRADVTTTATAHQHPNQQSRINDEFAIAMQLLQNNILMICMNVGVPIDQLYPGEAILLNLYALQMYCSDNV